MNKFLGMRVELDDMGGFLLVPQAAIEELLQRNGMASAHIGSPIGDEGNDAERREAAIIAEDSDS